MSTFIKDFIEREKLSRRNFLFASAAGLTSAAVVGPWSATTAHAGSHGGWSMAWRRLCLDSQTGPVQCLAIGMTDVMVESLDLCSGWRLT